MQKVFPLLLGIRRALWVTVGLVLLSTVSSCDRSTVSNAPTTQGSAVRHMVQRGEMRVGYLVWNPCIIRDSSNGAMSGIYVDMVNYIAATLKLKVIWQETTLANFTAGLETGQFDFCVGPTFITVPRATAVAFTKPVAFVGNGGIVRTDGNFKPQTIRDLNRKGLRVAVLQGQAMEEYCRRNAPDAEVIVIAGGDLTAPLAAVSAGRADIGLMNVVTIQQYASEHPEVSTVLVGDQQVEILPLAWTTRRGDSESIDFLNASIVYLQSTGRLTEFQNRYPIRLLYDVPKLHDLNRATP